MASTLIMILILTSSLAAMVGSYLMLNYSFTIWMTDEERGCEDGEVRLHGGALWSSVWTEDGEESVVMDGTSIIPELLADKEVLI